MASFRSTPEIRNSLKLVHPITTLAHRIMEKQKHGVPAILSFFIPGLGQLIKGQILKAILIWAIGGVVSFFLWWTIVVPFVIWAWNVYDAYNSND